MGEETTLRATRGQGRFEGNVLLRDSVDLGVSVVKMIREELTTEAPRSTESRRGVMLLGSAVGKEVRRVVIEIRG